VAWSAVSNGFIFEPESRTDAEGRATAGFVLGPLAGPAVAMARVASGNTVTFALEARPDDGTSEIPLGEIRPLRIPTYDGSGQVVHPDHAATPSWAFGRQLAITPYPAGNAGFEIPSLFSGRTGDDWLLAPGVPNPVVAPLKIGYLSDPDLLHLPETGELYLYYRAVTDRNIIYLVRSTNGTTWTAPELVVAVPNHELVSPAVVRRAPGDWWMWSVNAGVVGCSGESAELEVRRSIDGRTWGPPGRIALAHGTLTPWHVDVQWIPSRAEFWALYNVKQPGGCATSGLFLATSADGATWTAAPNPVLVKGRIPEFRDIVYRSTFEYRPASDDLLLWYSGARLTAGRWTWSAAVERRTRAELFTRTQAASTAGLFVPPPAELEDWP
jgi:hypothetical protein